MNYIILTSDWGYEKKTTLLKKIMKETGLPFRVGAHWIKNLEDTVETNSTFIPPKKTPYIEVNCFGEDNVCIRKMTNMTEANRKGLAKIVDDIVINIWENKEVVNV